MMKFLMTMLATGLIAASAEGRALKASTTAVQFLPGIAKSCQQVCQSPIVFGAAFSKQPASFSCRINLDNGEVTPGFQAGSNTCTSVYYGKVITSTNYDCGCLPPASTIGLDLPVGEHCSGSCSKVIGGSPGSPLVDGVGHMCLASTEVGTTNHFGYTDSGLCNFVPGGSQANGPTSTNLFSCICSYPDNNSKGSPAISVANSTVSIANSTVSRAPVSPAVATVTVSNG